MLAFDIGANRGDWTIAALDKGYKVIAIEAAPRVFGELVKNFIYNPNVVPLKFAVSDKDYEQVEFYEANEDGLSTLNKDWLTNETLPYAGKPFRTISATTITLDTLVSIYGEPDLIKVDVEGAEWSVLRGMTKRYSKFTMEWTDATIDEHDLQIKYLADLGYKEIAPQFIEHHAQEPDEWYSIESFNLTSWINYATTDWVEAGWENSGLRPTADVGMLWFR